MIYIDYRMHYRHEMHRRHDIGYRRQPTTKDKTNNLLRGNKLRIPSFKGLGSSPWDTSLIVILLYRLTSVHLLTLNLLQPFISIISSTSGAQSFSMTFELISFSFAAAPCSALIYQSELVGRVNIKVLPQPSLADSSESSFILH